MKKLLMIPLLLATQILGMQPELKPEENDWRITFIPTIGTRIPLHIVQCDKTGKHFLPVDPEKVGEYLADKARLQALFAKYGTTGYSLEDPSEFIALLLARGDDGYRAIETSRCSFAITRVGFCHLDEGTIDRGTYAALKEECYDLDLLSPFEITPQVVDDAQRLYFSLYPEENKIQFNRPFCTTAQTTIRKLRAANVPHENNADYSMTFFLNKKKSHQ